MLHTTPPPAEPLERLAARICKLTNTKGGTDAGPVIAEIKRRKSGVEVDAAIKVAIEHGWLRREGSAYVVTPTGAELGRTRRGKRIRRVMPF